MQRFYHKVHDSIGMAKWQTLGILGMLIGYTTFLIIGYLLLVYATEIGLWYLIRLAEILPIIQIIYYVTLILMVLILMIIEKTEK
jgi:hypothetical protein